MKIRRAEAADAEGVGEAFLAAREEWTHLPQLHTEAETRRWIREVLLATREVWVAEEEGRVVGFAALGAAFLEHLYVHPDKQSRGVGAKLLAVAQGRRPDGFQLWVFQANIRARRFYERHGLELVRLTDGEGNEEREPDALYAWRPR
jgi:ribosomal protein S18 acetylase RimI-like enzyme